MVAETFERARKGVEFYESETESWKVDHQNAMVCSSLEEAFTIGIYAFRLIMHADREYRRRSFEGSAEFDETTEKSLFELLRSWSNATKSILQIVKSFEQSGYAIERADALRSIVEEAEGILTEDAEFFDSPKMAELAEQAVALHRAGETEELM